MTKSDNAFEASRPGFYIFEKPRKRHCKECDDLFETSLDLNQFCLPKCKSKFLHRLTA